VKYFNTLQAWKLVAEQSSASPTAPKPAKTGTGPTPQEQPGWLENETSDDLPF